MKRMCRISKAVPPEKANELFPIVKRLGLTSSWRQTFATDPAKFAHVFEEGDSRIGVLCRALNAAGLDWLENHEASYTYEELQVSTLLEFSVEASPRDVVHEACMFDFSTGCPRCHAGARQTSSLKIRASALPTTAVLCQTMDFEYLVSGCLYQALLETEPAGLDLMQVRDTKGRPLGWWQLVPRYVMPPMAREQRGHVRKSLGAPCTVCNRDGYCITDRDEVPQIAYRRSHLGSMPLPDVVETWECYGVWALIPNGAVARGRVLMSPRVLEVFRQLGVPSVQFQPIRIIED